MSDLDYLTRNTQNQDQTAQSGLATYEVPQFASYSPAEASIGNRWFGINKPFKITLEKLNISVKPIYLPDFSVDANFIHFSLNYGTAQIFLHLERAGLEALFKSLPEKIDLEKTSIEDKALLMEFLFAPLLHAFETYCEVSAQLKGLDQKPDLDNRKILTGLAQLENDKQSFIFAISYAQKHTHILKTILLHQTLDLQSSILEPKITVPLSLNLAAVHISINDLKHLSFGDVILLEEKKFSDETYQLWAGSHFLWSARKHDNGIEIISGAAPADYTSDAQDNNEKNTMTNNNAIDEIPVTLTFEVGRKAITIEELRQLNAGSIVQFPDKQNNDILVYANGQKIGLGSLVQIGDDIGVKIEKVFEND